MALFVRRRWPKAVAAVAVLAAAAALVAWLGTRDSGSPAVSRDDPEIVETASPIPDPVLPSTDLATLAGLPDERLRTYAEHSVEAAGAEVTAVVGPSALWIGSGEARLLVVLVSTTAPGFGDMEPGARLSFRGVLRASTPDFGQALGLTGADDAEFRRQGAYIEIDGYQVG